MRSSQDPEMWQLFLSPMIKCKIGKPFSLYLLIIFAQVTPCLHAHICVSEALPESPTLSCPKTDRSRSAWRKCERLPMRTNKAELHLGKDRLKMYLPSIHKNTTSCHVEEGSASVSQGLEHSTGPGRPWLPRAVYSDSAALLCLFLSTQQQA